MKFSRREFARTSAGLLVTALSPGIWSCRRAAAGDRKSFKFETWGAGKTLVPITRITPPNGLYIHTYYDVCPWSPSQRYLVATRLPYQDKDAVLGDTAEVCVIDLQEQTIETVYTTKVWGFQTGAKAQWGDSDRYVYTNDLVNGAAVCARIDRLNGEVKLFAGPMYHVAPDGSAVIAFPLELLNVTQLGYGLPSPDPKKHPSLPPGAAKDQGLWRTDLKTNEKRLLVSLADLAARIPEPPPRKNGTYYLWHCRYSPQGTRILQVFRCLFPDGYGERNPMVFTFKPDGSDIRVLRSKPSMWNAGGGHPNWHGDGQHIIRNLAVDGKRTRFCQFHYDGSDFRILTEKIPGGGHPRIDPAGRYIVTDTIERTHGVETVALRYIDLKSETEQRLCEVPTIDRSAFAQMDDKVMRLDGHPTFSRDHKKVCFQAAPAGNRQLMIADLTTLVG
jgi:hypothetical protein